MKKILSIVLTIAMIFSMMPATFALESENVGAYNSLKLPVVNEVGEESKVSLMGYETLQFESEYYSFGSSDEWTSLWMDESVASMLPADLSGTGCTLSFCFKDPTNTVVTTMGGIPVDDLWIDNWEGVCYGGEIYFMLNLTGVPARDYIVDVTLYDSNGTAYNLGSAGMVVTDKTIIDNAYILNYGGELTTSTESFYVCLDMSNMFLDYDKLTVNLLDRSGNVVAETVSKELYDVNSYNGSTLLYKLNVTDALTETDYSSAYTLEILSDSDLELISAVNSVTIRVTADARVIRAEFSDTNIVKVYTENVVPGKYLLKGNYNTVYNITIDGQGIGTFQIANADSNTYYYFTLQDLEGNYIDSFNVRMNYEQDNFSASPNYLAVGMTRYNNFFIRALSKLEKPSVDQIEYARFTQNGEVVATMTNLKADNWSYYQEAGTRLELYGTVFPVADKQMTSGTAIFEIKYTDGFVYTHTIPVAGINSEELFGSLELNNSCYYNTYVGDNWTNYAVGSNQVSFELKNINATSGTISLYEAGDDTALETLNLSGIFGTVTANAYYTYPESFYTTLSADKVYTIKFVSGTGATMQVSNFTYYPGKLMEQNNDLIAVNGSMDIYCYEWLNISDINNVTFKALVGNREYALPVAYNYSGSDYLNLEVDTSNLPVGHFSLKAYDNGAPIPLSGTTMGYNFGDTEEPRTNGTGWHWIGANRDDREFCVYGANLDKVNSASVKVYKAVEFNEAESYYDRQKLAYVKDIPLSKPYGESYIAINNDLLSDLAGGSYLLVYILDGEAVETQNIYIAGEESGDTPVVPPVVNPDVPSEDWFNKLQNADSEEEFIEIIFTYQDELIAFGFEELFFGFDDGTCAVIAKECLVQDWTNAEELKWTFNGATALLCSPYLSVSEATALLSDYGVNYVFEEHAFLSFSEEEKEYVLHQLSQGFYNSVESVQEAFGYAVVLMKLNNAENYLELEECVLRYSAMIGVDFSEYNTMQKQELVWQMLYGKYYGSFAEFVKVFDETVAALSATVTPGGGSGGSSGSTSGFWIYEAKAEKGLLCVSAASADFIPEDSAVMLAVYEEKQNRLVTLQQINLSDCENEGGYYEIAEEIPFDKLGKFRIKMMVWDSLDTMQTCYQAPEYIFDAVYETEPTVVTLKANQLYDADFYGMRYYDENGTLHTINFSDNVILTLNGETLFDFDLDVLYSDTVESIVCTDLDNDRYFDNISITEVQTFVVDSVEDNTIYAMDSAYCIGAWYLELYDADYTIKDDDGNAMELSDIKKNDILKIYRKADVIDIIVTGKKVTGLVTKVKESADDFIVYVGESAYYLGNFRWCNYYPKPGETVTIIADEKNQIFRIKGELTGFSAAVLLAQNETSDFNPQLQLMVKQGEETKILEVANEVVIDDRYFMEYDASYYLYRGELLLYRTNAKGEIDKIYTSSANNDLKHAYGVSYLDFYVEPVQFLDMKLGDYIFTATTQIYMVDGRELSEDNLYSVSPTQLLNGARYVGEGFVNEDGELLTVLLYSEASQFFNPMQIPFVVSETSYIYDDGEVKTQLDGYVNGVAETLIISPECNNTMYISIGSAILYTKNFDGEVSDYEILIDGNNIYVESYGSMISGLVDRIEDGKLYFADDPYNGYAVDESVVAYRYIPRTRTLKVVPIYDAETYSNDYYCDDAFSYYSYNDKVLMYYIIDQDGDNDMPIELPEGYTTDFTVRQMSGNTIYIAEADDMIPGKLVLDSSVEYVLRKENGEEVTKLSKGDKVTLKVMKNLSSYKFCYYFTVTNTVSE